MFFQDKKSYIISFITALAVANVSGPQYVYPTYGTSLATKFHWNGIENSVVSTATFVGVSFSGPLCAWMVETSGIKNTLRIASFSAFMGLLLLAQTYAGYLSSHYMICSFYLAVTGAAGAASYICSLDSQAHNFKAHRGMSMGLASASLGISGLVFSQINDRYFISKDTTFAYLLFIGSCTALVTFLGSFILGPLNPNDKAVNVPADLIQQQQDDLIVAQQQQQNLKNYTHSISSFSTSSTQVDEDNEESRPLLSKNVIVSADKINLLKKQQQMITEEEEPEISGIAFFSDPVGFALSVALLVILGLGYVYLANIGQILHALSPPTTSTSEAQHSRNLHTGIFSLANCASRAVFGTLSDILQRRYGVHRLWLFWFASLGLVIGMTTLITTVSTSSELVSCTVMIAVAYGITFGIAPATISEFGTKAFARNWGLLLCAPAIGSQSFSVLFGTVYEHESKKQNGVCYGVECFELTFFIGIISAFVCMFVLSLAIYKKGLYKLAA